MKRLFLLIQFFLVCIYIDENNSIRTDNKFNINPEGAFDYSRVILRETVRSNAFTYNAAHPMLIPGMRYAWRVRAIAKEGIEEITVIKNNGYSQVFWFDYAANCQPVQVSGAVYEDRKINITWIGNGSLEYTVEYRKKGSSKWYTGTITEPEKCVISNLTLGAEYEYKIGSRCAINDIYTYTDPKAFRMPDKNEVNPRCGLMPDVKLSNQTPAMELQAGLPVLAGDFPVFITKVSGAGRFSGEGYVGIPYISSLQVAVTFKDIAVNTDNQLISGYFETKYDAKNNLVFNVDETLTGGKGVGDIRTGEEKAQYTVDYSINPNIKALPVKSDGTKDEISEGEDYTLSKNENGLYTFIITDSEGNEHKVETEEMPATILDKDGNSYQIDNKGNITPISGKTDIQLNEATKNIPRTDIATLSFESTNNTKYAVDQYKEVYAKVTEYFLKYKPTDEDMIASAKFMVPGASDEIFVRVVENKMLQPNKVHFVTDKGKEYKALYDVSKQGWTLTLLGSDANDGQNLYVVQEESTGKYATLARLNIYAYEPKTVKVQLVPVNGFNNDFSANTVSQQLNSVYNQVGITCEVEMANSFDYEPLKTKAFNVTGSGLFSTLTDDMKAINNAYIQTAGYKEDVVTLFIIENVTGNENVTGDMPRAKQFGYLFKGATSQTIAHEIGHGVFHLDHPFARANASTSFGKGDLKDNVMEYPPYNGNQFVKLQWDAMHSPGVVIGVFEKDEDAQLSVFGGISWLGDFFGGLASDEQEKEIETMQSLLDHVYDSYTDYFEKSKVNDINVTKTEYKDWSIRKSSHSGKICKSIYSKLNEKRDNTLNLHDKGIYVENYELESKSYQVSVYSTQSTVDLKNDKIRLKGYKELADHTYVKAGYTKKYGIIVFYNESKKFQLLLQISGQDTPEKIAEQWLNYLAIVVASDEQKEFDKSIWEKIKDKLSQLFTIEELPKIWDHGDLSMSDFEIHLFDGDKRSGRDSIMLITSEPKMPVIKAKPVASSAFANKEVELRLQITYQRDGIKTDNTTPIPNVRDDVSYYPAEGWKKVKMNTEWKVDFGQEIRGGTAYLFRRCKNEVDTIKFYIRGTNPTEAQIKDYLRQKGYLSQYWFIVKMTRQESAMRQHQVGGKYQKTKLKGSSNALGEPLYGPPRGFGLKQLDNWGSPKEYAFPQHLWNWKENIEGGVEVIKEKKAAVDKAKAINDEIIEKWNKRKPSDMVNDSLYIDAGENAGTTVLTITEGNVTFAVSPTGNQIDIYDARWIKLFNGGELYYYVTGGGNVKPKRIVNRTNNADKNYVKDVCGRSD